MADRKRLCYKLLRSAQRKIFALNLFVLFLVIVVLLHRATTVINIPEEFAQGEPLGELIVKNDPQNVQRQRATLIGSTENPLFMQPYLNIEESVTYNSKFHTYQEHVDLRVIILTFDRNWSLQQVLQTLQKLELDGHRAILEIWIDRSANGTIDQDVYKTAREFRWDHGPVRVHVHSKHVGLYGQWIHTWRPQKQSAQNMTEIALYLEDDTDISPYGYRWLRACFEFYKDRDDIAGFGLQDENAKISLGKDMQKEVPRPAKDPVFLYKIPGSWGFAPHPIQWKLFQDWYEEKRHIRHFKPYVKEARMHTMWYKTFEKNHKADSMWTMWFIRFTYEQNLWTFYSNLPTHAGRSDVSLVSNRRERGLHFNPAFNKRLNFTIPTLMNEWEESYVQFPANVLKYGYDGRQVR